MPRPEFALLVFLDGVGLGSAGPHNPLSESSWPALRRLAGDQDWTHAVRPVATDYHVFTPLDATLGLDGLPQSGTGQASLYTGINTATLAGRHYGPHAPTTAHGALASHGLWARLQAAGVEVERLAFATAYPERFFAYGERTGRWPTAARMARACGVRLRAESDVRAGTALTAEITGAAWRERLALDVPLHTPDAAGRLLVSLAAAHAVTLFEHYDTDTAGHSRDPERAAEVLARVDGLLGGVLDNFDDTRGLLLVTSDHGNLEDLSVKTHTRHPVPLVAWGKGASAFAACRAVTDVTPTLVNVMTGHP
jgi:2,3-bisphosphoglycerate-independent phosphoglycerate mutase